MTSFLAILFRRTPLALLLAATYFIAVVLPHDLVGAKIYAWLFHGSIPDYNRTFLLILAGAFMLILPGIIGRLRKSKNLLMHLVYLFSLIALMITAYFTIMVLATEMIHWPQYAVMAILLFPLTGRAGETMIWAALLGACDEGWQYFALASSDYYDFNDVVLNFLGAALGIWILSLYPEAPMKKVQHRILSPGVLVFLLILGSGFLAHAGGALILHGIPESAGAWTLSPEAPEAFWSAFHASVYHILMPWEALCLLLILYHYFRWLYHRVTAQSVSRDPIASTRTPMQ